jgi:hypothetical protein
MQIKIHKHFNYLLAHEKALAEFATRELKGQMKTSLVPVLALLDNPYPIKNPHLIRWGFEFKSWR